MKHLAFKDTDLEPEIAQSMTETALQGADDGELYIEQSVSESFSFDDGRLKNASYDASRGFGLRRVIGLSTGFAHATQMTPAALQRAADAVRGADRGQSGIWADAPVRTNQRLYGDFDPTLSPDFASKTALLQEIDSYVRAQDPRVIQVSASLTAEQSNITILRPGMDPMFDSRPLVRIGISVTVEQNGRRESGFTGAGGRSSFEQWIDPGNWRSMADEALRQAIVNLDAIDISGGEMDVVLGPGWPGILFHEAVGHGLEGDFNRKGESAFSGRIGERVAAKGVTLVDDGTLHERRGSLSFDDEGTPTARTVLIEDGILKAYMQDRQNARLMGQSSTGNGRRMGFACPPMPRMTNTVVENGDHDPAEILASLQDGVYAVNFGGGQVDITSGKFVFQCTEAYLVKDGKIGAPIKGATLIGDGPTALTKISMIGNDQALDPGIGVCGKAGQGVPVGVGQPTLKIGGLTVGGAG
ncbi:TldD protein, part of TldE/TldD proteolytic complex [hydrothermal vent metagenome]|uniref:TldD protein, part of TldE/TldD proteolytic complex n=1 Tax=hydrothermal vent metagenome TaxID=652676 RepID=A0A3B0RGB6_9ZZZZ